MEIKLTRTDKRPLVFSGREIASETTKTHDSNRWHNVKIYETNSGKIVVGIARITCWQGERDFYQAEAFASREAAISHIEEHAETLASELAEKLGVSERL